ncbi:MAG: hypothetical protein ACRC3B_13620, partial [Bacteroidia bacterium]
QTQPVYTLSSLRNLLNTHPPDEFVKLLYTVYHNELCKIASINPAGASLAMIRYGLAGKNIADEQCAACIRPLEELAILRYSSPQAEQSAFWYEECLKCAQSIGYNN